MGNPRPTWRNLLLAALLVPALSPLSCNGEDSEDGEEFRGGMVDTRDMIAFVSSNDLFVVRADGTDLTEVGQGSATRSPAWSPDGTRIAYVSSEDGRSDVRVVDVASGVTTQLTDSRTDSEEGYLWWSPDGRRLAFQSVYSFYDANNFGSIENVHVVNADGSRLVELTNNETLDVRYQPWGWSPDGRSILLVSSKEPSADIYTLDADTGTMTEVIDTTGEYARDDPAWSPDGSLIAYVDRSVGQQIAAMKTDGTGVNSLHYIEDTDPSLVDGTLLVPPSVSLPQWSPDSEAIAFIIEWVSFPDEVDVPSQATGDIYAVQRDGTGLANLTNHPASDGPTLGHDRRGFSWSPDGTRIVFVSNRDGTDDLYVMNADGSGVRQLTYSSAAECCGFGWLMDSPVWSPSK
jgi:Tol biopolymer transport system component